MLEGQGAEGVKCSGCASGLAKNFTTLVEILGTFTEVKLAQAKVPSEASAVSGPYNPEILVQLNA